MEKNIVTVISDNRGNVIERIADYIGVEHFTNTVYNLYCECLSNFEDSEEFGEYLNETFYSKDYLYDKAEEFAFNANEGMKRYLHMKNHRIDGNFANIEQDYPCHITGTYWSSEYDGDDYFLLFPAMLRRLDSAEDSSQASADRAYLEEWYFRAFGTYNIKYNFSNDLQEAHYMMEEEIEKVPIATTV